MATVEEAALTLALIPLFIGLIIPLLNAVKIAGARISLTLAIIASLSFTASAVAVLAAGEGITYFNGLVYHDAVSGMIMLGSGLAALIALASAGLKPGGWSSHPAWYSLIPLALFGVFFLTGAIDTLMVLAAWLLVSVISYVIVALPDDLDSVRAAARYIYVGAVATILLSLWIAFNATVAGEYSLDPTGLAPLNAERLSALALATVLAGLGFKLGAAPFHWWLPSVYGRADGKTIAVVSGMIKLGFIGLLTRIIVEASRAPMGFENLSGAGAIALVMAAAAVASMTYGNIAALTPTSVRAILAYSSIAHVGYILTGLAAVAYAVNTSQQILNLALAGIAVQAVAYGLAKTALFATLPDSGDDIKEWARNMAATKTARISASILLLSLLGLPPLLGFWGKLYLFLSAAGYSLLLVAIALVNSGISSFYYVRLVREILSSEPTGKIDRNYETGLLAAALLTLLLGLIAPLLVGLIA